MDREGNRTPTTQAGVGPTADLEALRFNPEAKEFHTSWSTYSALTLVINAYPNGIAFSMHENTSVDSQMTEFEETASDAGSESSMPVLLRKFEPYQFSLRVKETRDYQLPEGKYFVHKDNFAPALERQLSLLNKKGLLQRATVYFGSITDPFLSFNKKFNITMSCLDILERFRPGRLVIQSRSPMLIAALPTLKYFGKSAVAVVPIETMSERSVLRYTPGQPRIAERLIAAEGLRRQGITVNLAVTPILPYGDFYRDAFDFAEMLNRHGDYISLACLASGSEADERVLRTLPVARKLETDAEVRYLRPYAYRYLYHALQAVCPAKLVLPVAPSNKDSQLELFAA